MEQQKKNKKQVQNIKQYIAQKIINQKIMKLQERKIKEMQYTKLPYIILMKKVRGFFHTQHFHLEKFHFFDMEVLHIICPVLSK